MENMKVVRIHNYGGPEVLKFEDAPRPHPADGEVLIRIHAAAVNPVDWKIRAGRLQERIHLPVIPGWDLSGVVEATGPGVTVLRKGNEVYGMPRRLGAYAEYMVVKESEVALKPRSVDHIQAAAVPLAALTAWQAIFDVGELKAGQKALIHAASGGVGSFAVQLAKWKGTHVIGTASGRNQSFLRELGVDEPIDYEKTRFEDVTHEVDVVLDIVGGDTQKRSWKVLKTGGILVSIISPPSTEEAAKYGVRSGFVHVQPNASQLSEIAKLVDSGKLKPMVETVLPLSEARRAQEQSQTGHARGKIVLKVA